MRRFLLALACLVPLLAYAGEARDLSDDPVTEKRMVKLAEELRCLVCQNESLASSHAELADDLRQEVREKIRKGLTDQQIKDYLVARYGDFVLYQPPVKRTTYLLWAGPFILLLAGMGILYVQLRKRKSAIKDETPSAEALQRAAAMLSDEKEKI